MKTLPKILLIIAIALALIELVPALRDAFYTIHRPLSAVFFGLFLITLIMGKESESYDADHPGGHH
jgi:putative exporter of polyketide antibiotics